MLRSKIKRISKYFVIKLNTGSKRPIHSSSSLSIVNWKVYLEEKENNTKTTLSTNASSPPGPYGMEYPRGYKTAAGHPPCHPRNSIKAVSGEARPQGIEG
jgi:hypothetical protein